MCNLLGQSAYYVVNLLSQQMCLEWPLCARQQSSALAQQQRKGPRLHGASSVRREERKLEGSRRQQWVPRLWRWTSHDVSLRSHIFAKRIQSWKHLTIIYFCISFFTKKQLHYKMRANIHKNTENGNHPNGYKAEVETIAEAYLTVSSTISPEGSKTTLQR